MGYQTVVRKAFLQGTTPRIKGRIADEDKVGYKPTTLTMSIYDHACVPDPGTNDFVNGRDDDDVLSSCDASGNVELWLDAADTEIADLGACDPSSMTRRVLFRWTWSSGARVGAHEVVFTIAANFETVAA